MKLRFLDAKTEKTGEKPRLRFVIAPFKRLGEDIRERRYDRLRSRLESLERKIDEMRDKLTLVKDIKEGRIKETTVLTQTAPSERVTAGLLIITGRILLTYLFGWCSYFGFSIFTHEILTNGLKHPESLLISAAIFGINLKALLDTIFSIKNALTEIKNNSGKFLKLLDFCLETILSNLIRERQSIIKELHASQ